MNNTTPIIGLAGGIGSGKSTITKCFNAIGIQSVDADDVARFVVKPGSDCLSQIHQHYGDSILLKDGSLNRSALRTIIFNEPKERLWLESLTHPAIRKEIQTQLNNTSSKYALLVHPLLFETKQNTICQFVIAIDVSSEIQLQRVIARDQISRENAEKIIATQLSNSERINRADLVLENSGNINEMNAKVITLHEKILELLVC
ncbi:dephospho-CoA kinase [Marinomonas ushuaiensis DSM 15871]|uniref:Dephospho-CoA kinase n=2 Tax=Marinomonas TaxID=28253 RepID=X7E6D9_9GAMM|nr:dephospho-CoA kinase [Marinomonas ushuaiensis DSM 15871]